MKYLYLFIYSVGLAYAWFNLGAWYGEAKAEVAYQSPIPWSSIVNNSSEEYVNKYLLEQCLTKTKILEAKYE